MRTITLILRVRRTFSINCFWLFNSSLFWVSLEYKILVHAICASWWSAIFLLLVLVMKQSKQYPEGNPCYLCWLVLFSLLGIFRVVTPFFFRGTHQSLDTFCLLQPSLAPKRLMRALVSPWGDALVLVSRRYLLGAALPRSRETNTCLGCFLFGIVSLFAPALPISRRDSLSNWRLMKPVWLRGYCETFLCLWAVDCGVDQITLFGGDIYDEGC